MDTSEFPRVCQDQDGEMTAFRHPKLTLVNNGGLENEQVKPPGSRYEVVVQRTIYITITYKVRKFLVILIKGRSIPQIICNLL